MSRVVTFLVQAIASLAVAAALLAAGVIGIAGLIYHDPARSLTPSGEPRLSSLYLTMRDGTRIAADVWLPPKLAAGEKIPVLIKGTPYWRAGGLSFLGKALATLGMKLERPEPDVPMLNDRGYAVVSVDTRGTGASFGYQKILLDDPEVGDDGEIIDWAARQPWSNGKVGAYGFSYRGMLAVSMASLGRPALKAIAPSFDFTDIYVTTFPGGVFSDVFLKKWGAQTGLMNRGKPPCGITCRLLSSGPRRVDADPSGALLKQAIADHAKNYDVYACAKAAPDRESPICASGKTVTQVSEIARQAGVQQWRVPMYVTAGWFDATSPDEVLRRLSLFSNPQQVVVGAISHGGFMNTDPFAPANAAVDPAYPKQISDMADFFDHYLKADGAPGPSSVRYEVLNGGGWRTSVTWPPPGVVPTRWWLDDKNQLSSAAPAAAGRDVYHVDFSAASGPLSRWQSPVDLSRTAYPDRVSADRKLIAYTSAPLGGDITIAGDPEAALVLSSSATDGEVIVYLEDVLPGGRVVYLTEGVLRLAHRKEIAPPVPPLEAADPLHSHLLADEAPMTPGRSEPIRIQLSPIAVVVKRGERLRLAIAGADADNLERLPKSGGETLTFARGGGAAAFVELPVAP